MSDDLSLTLLIADIDEVLTAHHADTAQVVAAGQQLILSAFGQIVDDNGWSSESRAESHSVSAESRQTKAKANSAAEALADSLAEALRRRLLERITLPPEPMAEA